MTMKTTKLTAICGAMLVTALATSDLTAAPKKAEPEKTLSAAGQKLEARYTGQIETLAVDLGDGSTEPTRELRQHAVPALRYTFERHVSDRTAWTVGTTVGHRVAGPTPPVAFVALELGVRWTTAEAP